MGAAAAALVLVGGCCCVWSPWSMVVARQSGCPSPPRNAASLSGVITASGELEAIRRVNVSPQKAKVCWRS